MPLSLPRASAILLRRSAFERAGLTRAEFDAQFNLTDQEFRIEGDLIIVGPLPNDEDVITLADLLESRGLVHFDDYFDLSGNWPEWLDMFAMAR